MGPLLTLGLSGTGVSAAAAAAESGGHLAPYIQGGGSAAAVAGLVYVARMIIRGDLVARTVKDTELELLAGIRASGEREARVMQVVEEQRDLLLEQRSSQIAVMKFSNDVTAALTHSSDTLNTVATEMRWWKERRSDRG